MEEMWKPIKGFEGKYDISNMGRVKSLKRTILRKDGKYMTFPERLIALGLDTAGYPMANLWKNNRLYRRLVHRLVATAFIPNPNHFPVVNHKDFNPKNSRVENLEWCTQLANIKYSKSHNRTVSRKNTPEWYKNVKKKAIKLRGQPVVGINVHTGNIIKFKSQSLCTDFGFCQSCISKCCQHKQYIHKGYKWYYTEEYEQMRKDEVI